MLSSSENVWRGGKGPPTGVWSEDTSEASRVDTVLHPAWHTPHDREICLQDWKITENILRFRINTIWIDVTWAAIKLM